MRKIFFLMCAIFFVLNLGACMRSKTINGPILCTALYALPSLQIKLVDRNTGNSLLFGKNAKYAVSQIHVINLYNGRRDTNQFIFSDSLKQTISVFFGARQDTAYIVIPSYNPDTLLVQTASDQRPCSQLIISSAYLNRTLVCSPCNNYILTIQK